MDLAHRKLAQSIIAKMEIDCPGCMQRLEMNVHPVETGAMLLYCVGFVLPVIFGYVLERRDLMGAGVGIGIAGAAAIYLIERTYLRGWPRYRPKRAQTG